MDNGIFEEIAMNAFERVSSGSRGHGKTDTKTTSSTLMSMPTRDRRSSMAVRLGAIGQPEQTASLLNDVKSKELSDKIVELT